MILKKLSFIIIFIFLCMLGTALLKPLWHDWNQYDSFMCFYNQPNNTIETLFLGASTAATGFSPLEMYKDYGICSYNLSTQQQPMHASYYLLVETYKKHRDSLKNVVLEVSMIRRTPTKWFYNIVLDELCDPLNKLNSVRDISEDFENFIYYISPLCSYHARWKELSASDFTSLVDNTYYSCRGFGVFEGEYISLHSEIDIGSKAVFVPLSDDMTFSTPEYESLFYLNKITDFCKENNIRLTLTKTPARWNISWHNTVQSYADENALAFIDFNTKQYSDLINYNLAKDTFDSGHPNYNGAKKLSSAIGQYLVENCGATDVRGQEKYAFMEEELAEYQRLTMSADLSDTTELSDYISMINNINDSMIFITVKGEGSAALTQEIRSYLSVCGLEKLSGLEFRDSYIGVIDNGAVIYEDTRSDLVDGVECGQIEYEGKVNKNIPYRLKSAGTASGNISSCVIDGTEYSPNTRGLNIVVWDKINKNVIDSANFDTCASIERTNGNVATLLEQCLSEGRDPLQHRNKLVGELYKYNCMSDDIKTIRRLEDQLDEADLFGYLNEFYDDKHIICISVSNDAASSLTDLSRKVLKNIFGLDEFSQIEHGDSYIAIIDSGEIVFEQMDNGSVPISKEVFDVKITSGGEGRGNMSSIVFMGDEYSPNLPGVNVAVINKVNGLFVDSVNFSNSDIFPVDPVIGFKFDLNETSALRYLEHYSAPGYIVVVSALDDAAGALNTDARDKCAELGFPVLSELGFRDAYIAVVDDGKLVVERKDHSDSPICENYMGINISSAGYESGNYSSIRKEDCEYSLKCRGLNIAVFDKETLEFIDNASFDTCAVTPVVEY